MDLDSRPALVLMVAAGLTSCAPSSGAKLWARACEHQQQVASHSVDLEVCARSYAALPTALADDLARCALDVASVDDEGSQIRSCKRPVAVAYFEAEARTATRLETVVAAIRSYRETRGLLPETLDVLPVESTSDGWGRPLRFFPSSRAAQEQDVFTLCSSGLDGVDDTRDDICRPDAEFIYFEF